MQGDEEGLPAFFKHINKQAEYVPCAGHYLNLVGQKTASTVPETVDYFNILQQLHVSFSGSSRSWTIFNTRAKSYVSLNNLSVTGRSVHNTAVANLAMWVYRHLKGYEVHRHLKDSKICLQRLGRVAENRRKKVIQKDNKARIQR
jgi:hypothetical protein